MIGSWLLFCFILSSSYAGNLKGNLTKPIYSKEIETKEDIVKSGLPWGFTIHETSFFRSFLMSSDDPVIQTIWKKKIVKGYNTDSDVSKSDGIFLRKIYHSITKKMCSLEG